MQTRLIRKASSDPILDVADRLAGRVRRAYLNAVQVAAASLSLKDIASALQRGDTNAITAMIAQALAGALKGAGLTAGTPSMQDALQAVYAAAAKAAVAELPSTVSVGLSFNLMNPEAVRFLEAYSMDLIRQTTADVRAAINQVIMRGFQDGVTVADSAREIRSIIGLTARQEMQIQNYRNALSGGSQDLRDALSRALRDGRYDRTLLRAINEEKALTQAQIDALTQRYRERMLNYRADMVARTETVRAANSGQRETWRQARQQGLLPDGVLREWEVSGDDRTCDTCDGLDGETAALDEAFAGGYEAPPAHPNCRCTTKLVFPARERRAA